MICLNDRRPEVGRRRPAPSGWAESRRSSRSSMTQKSSSQDKTDNSDDDDLPVIPDLEEVEKEDFAQRVADAPNVAVNRVDTYKVDYFMNQSYMYSLNQTVGNTQFSLSCIYQEQTKHLH